MLQLATKAHESADGLWMAGAAADSRFSEEAHNTLLEIEENSFWFRHRNRCVTELLRAFPPPGTVLDVGAGNGFVTAALRDAGFDAIAVEPGLAGARNARSRGLKPVLCATLKDAGFPERSIPAAALFDVVEHVSDDRRFLSEVWRLLRPGGMLYVTVPSYSWLWSREDESAGHYRRYRLGRLIEMLRQAGFETLFGTHIFALLPVPVFFLRVLPTRLGFRTADSLRRTVREHRKLPGVSGRLIEKLFEWELGQIRRGRPVRFGASCMVAARVSDPGRRTPQLQDAGCLA